jgi:hypothetical protein
VGFAHKNNPYTAFLKSLGLPEEIQKGYKYQNSSWRKSEGYFTVI